MICWHCGSSSGLNEDERCRMCNRTQDIKYEEMVYREQLNPHHDWHTNPTDSQKESKLKRRKKFSEKPNKKMHKVRN
jgi:hypothetical protein